MDSQTNKNLINKITEQATIISRLEQENMQLKEDNKKLKRFNCPYMEKSYYYDHPIDYERKGAWN